MRRGAWAVPLLLAAGPCLADPPPRTRPARDVDITYEITRGGQVLQERSRYDAAAGLQRVDVAGTGSYMISDTKAGLVDMVNDAARRVVEMHVAPGQPASDPAGYTRLGQQSIAGLPCTDWQVAGAQPTVLCLTDDGVTLGMSGQGGQAVRAISVTYTPVDPAAFAVPPGYAKVSPAQPPG